MPRIPRLRKGAPAPAAGETQVLAPAESAGSAAAESTAAAQSASDTEIAAGAAMGSPDGDGAATGDTAVLATGVTPGDATVVVPADGAAAAPSGEAVVTEQADAGPGFRERTRMRRRLRYLRRLRELLFRDLGGLAFDLHRFGRERPDLLQEKLTVLEGVDGELRTLEDALGARRELTELREAGISACPRCGTLHDTDANFCPNCGTSLHGKVPAPPVERPEPQAEAAPAAS